MHVPVLLQEVLTGLTLQPNDNCVDGTVGGGGHSRAILTATAPNGKLVGFDRDADSLATAEAALTEFGDRFMPIHDSYAKIMQYPEVGAQPIRGILVDLGLSSLQLASRDRGFSFRENEAAPLDMRFDRQSPIETAADWLNTKSEAELAQVFRNYGEIPQAKRLAREIVSRRNSPSGDRPFAVVADLLEVVASTLPARTSKGRSKIHPATRVFQALRIAVNSELQELEQFLPAAISVLAPGGRLAVITFHSLEDRMVKQFFRTAARECVCPPEIPECRCEHEASIKLITRKPIIPSPQEIEKNPRSRSAKLRVVEKL